MNFQELLEWQWRDYADKHRHRTNLMIHLLAVPLVWVGALEIVGGVMLTLLGVPGSLGTFVFGAALVGGSLYAQARGHALEQLPPEKFSSGKDAVRRLVAEQFVTFPRFVLSGTWLANLKAAR